MTEETKSNAVGNFLWNKRNAMQKTGNVGAVTGLALGLIGVPAIAPTLAAIGCGIFYSNKTEHKGAKKVGLAVGSVFFSVVTITIGGIIGSSISGKEWLPSETTISTATTAPETSPEPVAPTPPPVVIPEKWNSDSKKLELEESIKENAANQFTGAEQQIASVKCTATPTENIWHCDMRKLGDPAAETYRIEYVEGTWAGQPL
jgi:hypothetical protein